MHVELDATICDLQKKSLIFLITYTYTYIIFIFIKNFQYLIHNKKKVKAKTLNYSLIMCSSLYVREYEI